jgi:glycosyltransferase involved in cell wall biosynthesis
MNILLLTQVLPYPPDSGPKVKTWNVIKYLAQHHSVTLVSFVRGDQSVQVRALESVCKAVYTVPISRHPLNELRYMGLSLLSGEPYLILRDDRAAMRGLVDRLALDTSFDIVHADQLNMAQYAARVPGGCKVLDAHNALWLLYKRLSDTMKPGPKKWMLGRDWRRLKTYEGKICREFDGVIAVSEEDKNALEEAAGAPVDIEVIPITVDTEDVKEISRDPEANHILHIGTMYWPPNIDGVLWFIGEVLPIIRKIRPEIVFDIVGANPPREILAAAEVNGGINVTGYVENPIPIQKNAGAMVVPLRAGGGMRVKILNAMAQGIPVVTTSLGCEGIRVESGRHLLIADTPQEFARATLRLLDDRKLSNELRQNARQLIQKKYDLHVAFNLLNNVYLSANCSRNAKLLMAGNRSGNHNGTQHVWSNQ